VTSTDTGLTVGAQYWYRLTAVSGAASGTPSSVVTATPPAVPTTPTAPGALTVGQLTAVSAVVTWTHPGTNLKGFKVERLMNYTGYAYQQVADLPGSARSFSDSCLRPGTPYLYRVSAFNEAGATATATSALATTSAPAAAPAGPPTGFKATQLTQSTYRVEWTPSCSTADRLLVEAAPGPGFTAWTSVLGTTQPYFMSDATWFIYADLPANTTQHLRVSAGNAVGFSATSAEVAVSGPTTASLPSGAAQVGIYADYDNTKVFTDALPNINATVYSMGGLTVGCFYSYNTLIGYQDFMCYSAAVHFPLSGTSSAGTSFSLAGKTVDRAYLVLSTSSLPVDVTNYSASAIAQAWSTSTLNGNTSLSLYTDGASTQGSPTAWGPYVFDVTLIVRNWVSGTFQNNGILLEDAEFIFPNADLIRTSFFFSTDSYNGAGNEKNKPTLWVDYH
jgi:hypothetical protein